MQREGLSPVVVHGGGKVITEWMAAQNVRPVFRNGLRVTDADSLKIVVAVLAGMINKGARRRAVRSGWKGAGAEWGGRRDADGEGQRRRAGDTWARWYRSMRRRSGRHCGPGSSPSSRRFAVSTEVDPVYPNSLLNVNADTVAGEIACAMESERLLFLTDVPGVLDRGRRVVRRMTAGQARALTNAGTVSGGMIPKIDACLRALSNGSISQIIDGREPGALRRCLAGESFGTRIG